MVVAGVVAAFTSKVASDNNDINLEEVLVATVAVVVIYNDALLCVMLYYSSIISIILNIKFKSC